MKQLRTLEEAELLALPWLPDAVGRGGVRPAAPDSTRATHESDVSRTHERAA